MKRGNREEENEIIKTKATKSKKDENNPRRKAESIMEKVHGRTNDRQQQKNIARHRPYQTTSSRKDGHEQDVQTNKRDSTTKNNEQDLTKSDITSKPDYKKN